MNNIRQAAIATRRGMVKHAPTILTVFSIIGLVATVREASKDSLKANDALRYYLRTNEKTDYSKPPKTVKDIPLKEKFLVTWKCYIPTIVMGTITAGLIIGSNTINVKRQAALAAMYTLADNTLREYQGKVVETLGEKAHKKVKDGIKEDILKNSDKTRETELPEAKRGTHLVYDMTSGRYFRSSVENIRRAENLTHKEINTDGYADLNQFYYHLGLPAIKIGDNLGWNFEKPIDLDLSTDLVQDEPCIVIDFINSPTFSFLQ